MLKPYMDFLKPMMSWSSLGLAMKCVAYSPVFLHAARVLKSVDMEPWEDDCVPGAYPFLSQKEKLDLVERIEWLSGKVVVDDPEKIIKSMPAFIRRHF